MKNLQPLQSLPNGPIMSHLKKYFKEILCHITSHNYLYLCVLHGDGTNTVAKKGGDGIGYSGHKHQKGEKVIAIVDNNGYVLGSSQHTTPFSPSSVESVTITHPHHPLRGQRVTLVRVRQGPDPGSDGDVMLAD